MSILRMLAVVVAAYLVLALLSFGGAAATSAAFGAAAASAPSARYLVINMVIGMVSGGAGGYLCARLAPAGRVTMSVGLLLVLFLAVGIVSGRAAATPTQPLWYHAVTTMLGASGILCGVLVDRAWNAGTAGRSRV